MKFWLFTFFCTIVTPVIMIILGEVMIRQCPRNINSKFGYRTARSVKNKKTWVFANEMISKLYRKIGWSSILLIFIIMTAVLNKSHSFILYTGIAVIAVELILGILPIIFTEKALKDKFEN